MNIRGLGYVGFGAPDPRIWLQFTTGVLGLMPARAVAGEAWGTPASPGSGPVSAGTGIAPDGSVYLKVDDWQWRIAAHPAAKQGLLYFGLELDSQSALERAVAELQAAGMSAELGHAEQARARSVTGIAYTRDPAGNAIELFYGPTIDRKFESLMKARFVCGPMGLGHLNLFVDELAACQEFYTRVLGFKLTDYMRFGPRMSANFYHCNARHHTVGLTRVGEVNDLHHLMLEMVDIDDVGKCLERAQAMGVPITSTLGRHVNDGVLSFYMRSPLGFDVEIGCGGVRIGADWTPSEFVEGDVWGHKGLDPESIQQAASGH
ncbi:VOC family protein [Burkholderia sp. BCC1993]|uniref:VOC family protein n=1 Tax=Burkholderia sp. BCC1993 TaxID=2817444 RepID=UPI002AB1650A|nr:VOC family protein [Burkholderia sp. BCC1993]